MKKSILTVFFLALTQMLYAQTYYNATNQTDGTVVTNSSFSTDPVVWLENGILEYSWGGGPTEGQLLAVSWMDAAGVSDFAFSQNNGDDWVNGLGFNTLSTYTLSNYSHPSVIVGGQYPGSIANTFDYYIGVVYVATDNGGTRHVYMDVWSITDPDPSPFAGAGTYTALCTILLAEPTGGTTHASFNINPGIPHADITTEDGGDADAFVVAWERSGTMYYNTLSNVVSGCSGAAINRVFQFVPPIFGTPPSTDVCPQIDICIMHEGVTMGVDQYTAYIAYSKPSDLMWNRWDVAVNFVGPPTNTGNSTTCAPRIDAIDLNSINSNVNNYFDVAYCYEGDIWNWPVLGQCSSATLTPDFPHLNCTTAPSLVTPQELTDFTSYFPGNNPVVACVMDGLYGIAYPADDGTNNDIVEQLITWNCGYFDGAGTIDYYEVDNHGGDPGISTGPVALHNGWYNDWPDYQFVCWFKPVVPNSSPEIAFKLDNVYTPAFKPGSDVNGDRNKILHATADAGIRTWPNPVKDELVVEGLAGHGYVIRDVTGRMVAEGKFLSGKHKVQLGSLANGMYLLDVEGKGKTKFVKE